MTMVASWDYPNNRFYLHSDTMTSPFNARTAYQEERTYRRLNASARLYRPMLTFTGQEYQGLINGLANYSEARVKFRYGVRYVPYNSSHDLIISPVGMAQSVEGLSNDKLGDKSSLSPSVQVHTTNDIKQVEIIVITVGSAVTAQDKIDIANANAERFFNEGGF